MISNKIRALILATLLSVTATTVGATIEGQADAIIEIKEKPQTETNMVILTPYERFNLLFNEGLRIEQERIAEEERLAKEKAKEEAERIRMEEELRIAEINRANSISFNPSNVLEPSYITAEELYQVFMYMDKPEMAELSWALTDAEYYTSVNSIFLAGLVAQESNYAKSYRAVYQNNLTGFCVYNSNSEGLDFVDKYSCIIQTAEWLKSEYLSPTGKYFNGYSTYDINIRYCLDETGTYTDFGWSNNINSISSTIESIYYTHVLQAVNLN